MLKLLNINKKFPGFHLSDINLSISEGEYFVLLGPSGAGKSLLFEMIGGMVKPDAGKIFLRQDDITSYPIQKRGTGMVFQEDTVFPHLSVFGNIAYPMRCRRLPVSDIKFEVKRLADEMNIGRLLDRKPGTLSGGERQRVAIARTLAADPKCLLFDEPLTFLDVQLRDEILALLRKLNKEGLTILHITHDPAEAFSVAGKIAVIVNGMIIRTDTPENIYHNPESAFVSDFTDRIRNQKKNLPDWMECMNPPENA